MLFQNLLQDCQTLCHGTWKTIAATHFCLFQYFLHGVDADIGCYVTRIASVGCASAAIIIRRRLSCKLFSFSQQGLLEFHVAFCQTNNHAQFGKPRQQHNAIFVRELLFLDGRLKILYTCFPFLWFLVDKLHHFLPSLLHIGIEHEIKVLASMGKNNSVVIKRFTANDNLDVRLRRGSSTFGGIINVLGRFFSIDMII